MIKFLVPILLFCSISLGFEKQLYLDSSNTVVIAGEVTKDFHEVYINKLDKLVKDRGSQDYELYLLILSPGGYLESAEQFINYAKYVENLHTITLASYSAAAHIILQLPGKRYIVKNGEVMLHEVKYVFGPFPISYDMLKQALRELELELNTQAKKNSKRLKLSEKEYRKKIKQDWIEEGENAVKANMVDEVVTIYCPTGENSMLLDIDLVKYFKDQVRDYFNCLQIGVQK